jgi:hypothetical protein
MAEVLGVVAGGFGVASLALQLVQAAQSLQAFWQSFESANAKAKRIQDHLAILIAISSSLVDICKQQPHVTCGDAVIKALAACKERMDKLTDIAERITMVKITPKPIKRWSSLKSTLKATLEDKTIQNVEDEVSRDVMMLLVALQPFFQ